MRTGLPRNCSVLPAERAEENRGSSHTGKPRSSRQRMSSTPTAPLAPTMATTNEDPDAPGRFRKSGMRGTLSQGVRAVKALGVGWRASAQNRCLVHIIAAAGGADEGHKPGLCHDRV